MMVSRITALLNVLLHCCAFLCGLLGKGTSVALLFDALYTSLLGAVTEANNIVSLRVCTARLRKFLPSEVVPIGHSLLQPDRSVIMKYAIRGYASAPFMVTWDPLL
ncbi:uncharacterized protein LAESUDRAFT_525771 [Laetiporus sulphureus 93-53]|uniref:Secreted protein n=1 Tax=Laetiporus sulphureus 93-53 TaxID=1314785 RepID=A0A165BCY5_9APHY|nr:uncharacterized protein LAESUDRAFT_525771 [Laetiporus sulphureus 93-53]KZT00770.1 hypothetical protein LAESUDRAFT_525771 [Laetiporus sulphureus 93-53]